MHNTHMNNLAVYREAKGFTQGQLAELVDLNQSTIQRAEHEHPSAKLATYKMCAKALGVSLADIFSDDRARLEQELLTAISKVPVDRYPEVQLYLQAAAGQPAPKK